jgi:hypothetical protein
VDGKEGAQVLAEYDKELSPPPETAKISTGREYHLYYNIPKDGPKVRSLNSGLKLDNKADGGYVVGPFSIHPTGAIYTPIRLGVRMTELFPERVVDLHG